MQLLIHRVQGLAPGGAGKAPVDDDSPPTPVDDCCAELAVRTKHPFTGCKIQLKTANGRTVSLFGVHASNPNRARKPKQGETPLKFAGLKVLGPQR